MEREDFCAQHHPRTFYRKLKRARYWIIAQFITIILFLINLIYSCQTEDNITSQFTKHSLAERILSSQYNPLKTQLALDEVLNLMSNDPSFRKEFYIDGDDRLPKVRMYAHNEDFRVDFIDSARQASFDRFLLGGSRVFTLPSSDYRYFYTIKEGQIVDSFGNQSVRFARDFPILPPLNISTIARTQEYLCTSILDVQIDSILGGSIYLSNDSQDNTFKVRLTYDQETGRFGFDQFSDIGFESSSSFYSIDQEVSYYEFMIALVSNARIRIRHAFTGEEIYVTDPFLPHNIDAGRSIASFLAKLEELKSLQWIQDYWGKRFARSSLSYEEYMILRGIDFSVKSCSKVTDYPFIFTLREPAAQKIIEKEEAIMESGGEIVSYDYSVTLLDQELNLGRISIVVPPSSVEHVFGEGVVQFQLTPHNQRDSITYEFTDLKHYISPDNVSHFDSVLRSKEPNTCFVTGLYLDTTAWKHSAKCE